MSPVDRQGGEARLLWAAKVQCAVEGHAEPERNDIISGVRTERWQCSRCKAEWLVSEGGEARL